MSLLTLPREVRDQILSYCVYYWTDYWSGSGLHWYDPASTLIWRRDEHDYEWGYNGGWYEDISNDPPSELLEAMPDLEVEALTMPQRRTDCSVLYVCRQLYDEAIRLFYELNIFHFWNPWLLGDFSDAASFMGNVKFITSLSIVVDLWDNSKNPELWKQWHGFLGEESHGGGLSWYFPGLKSLDIDFEPSSRMKERWGYSYVDGQPCSLYRRRLNQRPYCRQSGFDSFVDTLRRTVRVKKVSMCHLHDQELMFALKQEMMGLKVSSADWLPQNVYDPAVPSLRLEWGWQAEIEAEDEAAQSHAGDWGTSEAWD